MTKVNQLPTESNFSGENMTPDVNQDGLFASYGPCSRCDSCNSNICPHIYGNGDAWSPEDGACQHPAFVHEQWVKTQKKLMRKARNRVSMYTFEMLNRNFVVTAATEGLDPDKCEVGYGKSAETWIKMHPKITELSPEEKAKRRQTMLKVRGIKTLSEKRQIA